MADNVLSRKQAPWMSVSSLPSYNLTPMGGMVPVPYNLVAEMSQAQGASGNVTANTAQVHKDDKTVMPSTKGDEPGTGKGVASGTVGQQSWNAQKSANVKVNDQKVVRHDDKTDMEGDKLAKEKEEMKKRQECREEQVQAGLQSKDGIIRQRAERFGQNITAAQDARLSADVYNPVAGGPLGWINNSTNDAVVAQHGLNQGLFSGPGAYQAQLYTPDPAVWGNSTRVGPTVAFRGTTSLVGYDMQANIAQGTFLTSRYYTRATTIGTLARASGQPLHFTGHSLGGGLASAASQASGFQAFTFNAAGIRGWTVRNPIGDGSQIGRYYVRGEVLRGLQEPGAIGMIGTLGLTALTGAAMPNAVGIPNELNARSFSPIGRHGMDNVIPGIEDQKTEDQQAIAADTGKQC